MALSISKKLLGSSSYLRALSCCNYSGQSFGISSNALHSHVSGCSLFSAESSTLGKGEPPLLACRKLSTSILTPESSQGGFPSDLLSAKGIVAPERTIGLYQDLVIPVTNFHNEDKGFMVLAGDVFDVPIRKDIVHRVVRWQLAKRHHVLNNPFGLEFGKRRHQSSLLNLKLIKGLQRLHRNNDQDEDGDAHNHTPRQLGESEIQHVVAIHAPDHMRAKKLIHLVITLCSMDSLSSTLLMYRKETAI